LKGNNRAKRGIFSFINTEIETLNVRFMALRKKGKHRRWADDRASRRRRKKSKGRKAKNR
jgi:hypothetical protein